MVVLSVAALLTAALLAAFALHALRGVASAPSSAGQTVAELEQLESDVQPAGRPSCLGLRPGETVIVHTIGREGDGQSIRGVVVRELPTGLELGLAELLQIDGPPLALDGGAYVYREQIDLVQLVPTRVVTRVAATGAPAE